MRLMGDMMECDKCYKCDVCVGTHTSNAPSNYPDCFKDKSMIVELPAALGTNVWCIANSCDGCKYSETAPPNSEEGIAEYIEACQNCNRLVIIECKLDYELLPEIGERAFLTKEAAEKRLKELQKDV